MVVQAPAERDIGPGRPRLSGELLADVQRVLADMGVDVGDHGQSGSSRARATGWSPGPSHCQRSSSAAKTGSVTAISPRRRAVRATLAPSISTIVASNGGSISGADRALQQRPVVGRAARVDVSAQDDLRQRVATAAGPRGRRGSRGHRHTAVRPRRPGTPRTGPGSATRRRRGRPRLPSRRTGRRTAAAPGPARPQHRRRHPSNSNGSS